MFQLSYNLSWVKIQYQLKYWVFVFTLYEDDILPFDNLNLFCCLFQQRLRNKNEVPWFDNLRFLLEGKKKNAGS